jgi:cell division protein FtsI (penicillin-binding protein 3)
MDDSKNKNSWSETFIKHANNKFILIKYGIFLLFVLATLRLSYLVFIGMATNHTNFNVAKNYEQKHDILDRNGNVLALSVPSVSVYLNPKEIKDSEKAIKAISDSLGISEKIATKLVLSNSPFVWVKRNITKEEELNLKYYGVLGINFEKEQKRYYPYNNLFSHIVGITNIDGNGVSGVENSFNEELKRKNITLSLDLKIQSILREALLKAKENNQAKGAYGMVVDPKTFEVLAMVSLPDFNPNDRANINIADMFNYPTQGVFETGSIAKVFTVAMALNNGGQTLDKSYDVSKPIVKDNFVIVDYSYMNRSLLLPEILIHSSNIGTSLLMQEFGVENQKEQLEKFGLFNKPPLEIYEKESSLLPNKWTELSSMTISYGYGMAISQATFITTFSAIINGGIIKPLTIIKRKENEHPKETRIISEKVSKDIRGSLRLTVAMGSAKRADVPGYSVAGKTGSAEKLEKGKYNHNKVIASFVGFFPAYNPRYVILISIDEPKRLAHNNYNITGGALSTPVFADIVEKIGITYGIPKIDDHINRNSNIIEFIRNMPDLEIE